MPTNLFSPPGEGEGGNVGFGWGVGMGSGVSVGGGVRVADEGLVGSDDGVGVGVAGPVSVVAGEGGRVGVDMGVTASAVIADITVGASSFPPVAKVPQQLETTARMLKLRSARIDWLIGPFLP
jgi:hypothetical protein